MSKEQNVTPKSRDYIIQCQGCNLHTSYYMGGDLRPKCIINVPLSHTFKISTILKRTTGTTNSKTWCLNEPHIYRLY